MELTVTFPGGAQVAAQLNGTTILTDQPVADGGSGAAPTPYELFLASLATCAGYYVLAFCRQREISTDDISLSQRMEFDAYPDGKRKLSRVVLDIRVPATFPEKYRNALVKAAEVCAVKRVLLNPPEFEISTQVR